MAGHARPTLRCLRARTLGLHSKSAIQGYETYVAIRIIGSVPRRLVATILSVVPGCELDAWMSDYAMPERAVAPEEQIWSNIIDPAAAAKFLDQQP
jgi:hypothetical protein